MNTKYIAAIGLATVLCGCSALQRNSSESQATPTASSSTAQTNQQTTSSADGRSIQKVHVGKVDGEIIGKPAKNSKFSKIQIGMGRKQVEDIIGLPSDSHVYNTGKMFIPFYFGKDAYRIETFYKKEGSLTFEGGGVTGTSGVLIRVSVDSTADGYAHDGN